MKKIQTVAIIGAGCLGIMYSQIMTEALGSNRVFIIADEERIVRYRKNGLYANEKRCDFLFSDPLKPDKKADLIIFCVKFMALDEAINSAKGFIHPETIFLSTLNGISSEEVIGNSLGKDHLLYCLVYGMDATKENNRVRYTKFGTIAFGDEKNRMTEDIEAIARFLTEANINYEIPADIHQRQWSKLMLNAGVNQACAVFETNYGGIKSPGPARETMLLAMDEARNIAKLEGVHLEPTEIDNWMQVLDSLDSHGMPSMRQDLLANRPTEVELFSGTIRRLGQKHGVETPVNDQLYAKIKEMEREF